MRGALATLRTGGHAVTDASHAFHFAELFLTEKLKDFVGDFLAEAEEVTELEQSNLATQIQNFQRKIFKQAFGDAGSARLARDHQCVYFHESFPVREFRGN